MRLHLYVDTEQAGAPDGHGGRHLSRRETFGPFSTRQLAEQALVALCGRPDIISAHIRNPDPSTEQ